MRQSRLFSKTLREAPNGADCKGYEYLLRAGYIDQLAAGIFSLLPLGYRSIQKISAIVREEMDALGAQEILMPVVNPGDLWKETGRFYSIDREMSRFKDRNDRDMVLAMTHEECCTDLGRNVIDSYKRLPLLVYQLQTKWRDDPRPRAGLIRVREFTMKDSYSFDKDQEGLEKVYTPRDGNERGVCSCNAAKISSESNRQSTVKGTVFTVLCVCAGRFFSRRPDDSADPLPFGSGRRLPRIPSPNRRSRHHGQDLAAVLMLSTGDEYGVLARRPRGSPVFSVFSRERS